MFGPISKTIFGVSKLVDGRLPEKIPTMLLTYYENFGAQRPISQKMVDFLNELANADKSIKVIYDTGAAVGHFINELKPFNASIYAMDALEELSPFYDTLKDKKIIKDYYCGAFDSEPNKEVKYHLNDLHNMGGNSLNMELTGYYSEERYRLMTSVIMDDVVKSRGWPYPDLWILDVQSKEVDILKGAKSILPHVKYLIVELSHKEYNKNGILRDEAIKEIEALNFTLLKQLTETRFDGDYLFINNKRLS